MLTWILTNVLMWMDGTYRGILANQATQSTLQNIDKTVCTHVPIHKHIHTALNYI